MRGDLGVAHARGHRRREQERAREGERAQAEVARGAQLRQHALPGRRERRPRGRTSRTTKTVAAATCETTFAIAEPSMPSPKPRISASESATLARLEATSTIKPGARVLERAQPALRRGDHEHERRAERRDAEPLQRLVQRGAVVRAGDQAQRRAGGELEHDA